MGARVTEKRVAKPANLILLRPQIRGELARVAHPSEWRLGWGLAIARIAEIAGLLKGGPERLLLTGGGFITTYLPPNRIVDLSLLSEIVDRHIPALNQARAHLDVCIGLDLLNEQGSPVVQGIVFAGASGSTNVWKTLPVGIEANYIATFDDKIVPQIQRYVATSVGTAGLMVCHDLQMANHRTQSLVRPNTMRGRVIAAMKKQLASEMPELILNAVHWIKGPDNTRTFRTSLRQIVNDTPSVQSAAASFGYDPDMRTIHEVRDAFNKLTFPDFATTDLMFK